MLVNPEPFCHPVTIMMGSPDLTIPLPLAKLTPNWTLESTSSIQSSITLVSVPPRSAFTVDCIVVAWKKHTRNTLVYVNKGKNLEGDFHFYGKFGGEFGKF